MELQLPQVIIEGEALHDFHPSKDMSGSVRTLQTALDELSLEENTQCTAEESDDSYQAGLHFSHLKHLDVPQPHMKRKGSILKHKEKEEEELFISTQRRSWKVLPPPDMSELKRSISTQSNQSEPLPARSPEIVRRRRSVSFDTIRTRFYDQTIGDHPNVSYGPPISLDWKYEEGETMDVEIYEEKRGKPRKIRQLMLNYYQRKNVLMWSYGFSEEEIKKATRESDKIQFQRAVTKCLLPVSMVEDFVQSAGRKAKRVVKGERKQRSTSV
jgi:hypothetical protein